MLTNTNELIVQGNRCAVPWLHSQINLQNDTVTPCCKYKQSLGPVESFIKIWKSEELQKIKYDIKNGIGHENCSACDVPNDVFSYRVFKNDEFFRNGLRVNLDSNDLPQILNFSLKNICNLACRMCSPLASSRLEELSKKSIFLSDFYTNNKPNNKFDIESLKGIFLNVRFITISGGEPLIDNDCYELIQLIKTESSHLKSITFSTNFTKPNKNIIDSLKNLDCIVKLNISLDGPSRIHEYIRYGCNWSNIIENIQSNKDFSFGVNATVSVLNVGYIPELLDDIQEIMKSTGIKFTHVMASPVLEQHLHVGNLPNDVKRIYREKLIKYKNNLDLPGSNTLIKTGLDLLKDELPFWNLTKRFLEEFDAVTNTSYKLVYPELDIDD
jgi:MoaA/NifB/PqqE/SkfB family radical SAM enzyme